MKQRACSTTGAMLILATLCFQNTSAHDTWVETCSTYIRSGEYLFIDLRLGNHGNNHRDFKLASKVTLAPCTLSLCDPDGEVHDLKPRVFDLGHAEKEGYWSVRVIPEKVGLYEVHHELNILKGRTNVIKNSRTYFLVEDDGNTLRRDSSNNGIPSKDQLDLLLETPFEILERGKPFTLQLFFKGKPLGGAKVSIIPRGIPLTEDWDPRYEFVTESDGRVNFMPQEGNLYLAVVHHVADDESSADYDRTHYGSTLVLRIPNQSLKGRLSH